MAWTTPRTWVTAELVTAAIMNTHVRDDLSYLKGDAGAVTIASAILVPDYVRISASAGNKRLVMGNTSGGGASNPGIIESSNGSVRLGGGDSDTGDGGTFTATMQIGDGLGVYIGDTDNAQMTQGLTINQGASDNEVLALKSSDVAHGMTDQAETDTYGAFSKTTGASGGLAVHGYTEATSGLDLVGHGTTGNTTKSAAAVGYVSITGLKKSGTSGIGAAAANENIVVVYGASAARFILDADGDSHQDVGTAWTNFDAHDDADLLTALSVHVSRPGDPIKTSFRKFLRGNRKRLEALELVTFNRDGHHFVNMSRLTMLLVGAVRQANLRIDRVVSALRSAGLPPALLKGV